MVPPVGSWGSRKEFTVVVCVKGSQNGEGEVGKGAMGLDRERLKSWMEEGFSTSK